MNFKISILIFVAVVLAFFSRPNFAQESDEKQKQESNLNDLDTVLRALQLARDTRETKPEKLDPLFTTLLHIVPAYQSRNLFSVDPKEEAKWDLRSEDIARVASALVLLSRSQDLPNADYLNLFEKTQDEDLSILPNLALHIAEENPDFAKKLNATLRSAKNDMPADYLYLARKLKLGAIELETYRVLSHSSSKPNRSMALVYLAEHDGKINELRESIEQEFKNIQQDQDSNSSSPQKFGLGFTQRKEIFESLLSKLFGLPPIEALERALQVKNLQGFDLIVSSKIFFQRALDDNPKALVDFIQKKIDGAKTERDFAELNGMLIWDSRLKSAALGKIKMNADQWAKTILAAKDQDFPKFEFFFNTTDPARLEDDLKKIFVQVFEESDKKLSALNKSDTHFSEDALYWKTKGDLLFTPWVQSMNHELKSKVQKWFLDPNFRLPTYFYLSYPIATVQENTQLLKELAEDYLNSKEPEKLRWVLHRIEILSFHDYDPSQLNPLFVRALREKKSALAWAFLYNSTQVIPPEDAQLKNFLDLLTPSAGLIRPSSNDEKWRFIRFLEQIRSKGKENLIPNEIVRGLGQMSFDFKNSEDLRAAAYEVWRTLGPQKEDKEMLTTALIMYAEPEFVLNHILNYGDLDENQKRLVEPKVKKVLSDAESPWTSFENACNYLRAELNQSPVLYVQHRLSHQAQKYAKIKWNWLTPLPDGDATKSQNRILKLKSELVDAFRLLDSLSKTAALKSEQQLQNLGVSEIAIFGTSGVPLDFAALRRFATAINSNDIELKNYGLNSLNGLLHAAESTLLPVIKSELDTKSSEHLLSKIAEAANNSSQKTTEDFINHGAALELLTAFAHDPENRSIIFRLAFEGKLSSANIYKILDSNTVFYFRDIFDQIPSEKLHELAHKPSQVLAELEIKSFQADLVILEADEYSVRKQAEIRIGRLMRKKPFGMWKWFDENRSKIEGVNAGGVIDAMMNQLRVPIATLKRIESEKNLEQKASAAEVFKTWNRAIDKPRADCQ